MVAARAYLGSYACDDARGFASYIRLGFTRYVRYDFYRRPRPYASITFYDLVYRFLTPRALCLFFYLFLLLWSSTSLVVRRYPPFSIFL
jgi:hypothetical protein